MRAAVVEARAHDTGLASNLLDTEPQHDAGLQRRDVQEPADGIRHADRLVVRIAAVSEQLGDWALVAHHEDFLREGRRGLHVRLPRDRDVLLHDAYAVGGLREGGRGERFAEALRIDIMKRGDLHLPVGEDGAGLAHDLLHLVGREAALLVEGGGFEREVHRLQAHLALDLGAVYLAGRRRLDSRGAVLGKHLERVEGGIVARRRVGRGERHPDLDEWQRADDVPVADAADRRDLHAAAVAGAIGGMGCNDTRRLGRLAGPACCHVLEFGDLRRRGKLLAPVERGNERDPHEDGRGEAREKRPGKPACGHLAAVRRSAAPPRRQRRLVAEHRDGLFEILHCCRRFPPAQMALLLFVATESARPEPNSQRTGPGTPPEPDPVGLNRA